MSNISYVKILSWLENKEVDRPNAADNGTLSGHAAGEPFEKLVYRHLKELYPNNVYKQYEFLNDLYRRNPESITIKDRQALFNSPVALFLLSRGDAATRDWDIQNVFEEKQNDTADILFHKNEYFELIDVKTRNISKAAQAPNIISAYKVAQMCAIILDNQDFDTVGINYVEVDWLPKEDKLVCTQAHYGNLFKATPNTLYINWAAAMQIQFHVSELDQTYTGTLEEWAKAYLKMFVASAEHRCDIMYKKYVKPFKKYVEE
ncbi:MAG: HincII family type II restriction endonuclease [Alistipes sp.]|nr:HincII family type II restriction endonuclease [Alistipes sp.]